MIAMAYSAWWATPKKCSRKPIVRRCAPTSRSGGPYLVGWIGARTGEIYAAALHPKEIAYLRQMQESIHEEAVAIAEGVEGAQAELAALKAIGQLPEDIAQRYALTPDGSHRESAANKPG